MAPKRNKQQTKPKAAAKAAANPNGAPKNGAAKPAAKPAATTKEPVKKDIQKNKKKNKNKNNKDKPKKKGNTSRATFAASEFNIDESARYPGTVTFYRSPSGFGFLEPEDKAVASQVLVHWKEIQSSDRWPCLTKDLKVEFGIQKIAKDGDKFELKATSVTLPGGDLVSVEEEIEKDLTFVGERNMRFLGNVKFWHGGKGFGFVTLQDGYDIDDEVPKELFVPREQITAAEDQAPWLGAKMEVEFGIYKDGKGYGCYNVTLPGGDPIDRPPKEEKKDEDKKDAKMQDA